MPAFVPASVFRGGKSGTDPQNGNAAVADGWLQNDLRQAARIEPVSPQL
jgi:hypothetical protein